jgi:3-hydroxyisobutyrate dehydrogenase-like beta-hydroxyacid dehydrogenase
VGSTSTEESVDPAKHAKDIGADALLLQRFSFKSLRNIKILLRLTLYFNVGGRRKMVVGIIGVGTMGSRMLEKLIEARYTVYARDIDKKAEENAKKLGGIVVDSPAKIAEHAEIVLLSLPMPSDIDDVVLGSDGLLSNPKNLKVIVDLSTVDPFTTQKNAKCAKDVGVGYVDAPVLGRPQNCGKWTLPVGGEKEDIEKCRKVLEVLASRIIHVGPSGWGNVVKLLNNMMFGAINAVTAEIFAICKKFGMNPRILYEAIANSGAATVSNLFKELGPKILNRDFEPVFTIDLLHKDTMLGIEMAKKIGVPIFVSTSNQLLNEIAKLMGFGKEDTAAIVKVYERLLNIEVK